MGFIESLALLAAIGGGAYITVYYVIPALQQMAIAPYYYMQSQQQAPAPAPTTPTTPDPVTQNAEIPDEALDDVTSEEPLDEVVQDAVGDELEDAGLVEEPPEEKKDKKSSSKSDDDAFKKQQKRHERTVKSMDPKKDSRYKGMTSKQAGQAAKKKLLGYTTYYIDNRYLVVDDANIVREIY